MNKRKVGMDNIYQAHEIIARYVGTFKSYILVINTILFPDFLKGYNGTIFAYGQTGTGKTYTVEGNACKYKARGLATR